jgi:telomere length regulation protein
MEELLAPVSTSYRISNDESKDLVTEVKKSSQTHVKPCSVLATPEDALEALRSEPDLDTLRRVLKFLVEDASLTSYFKITQATPIVAQLVNVICSDIVPNYWVLLNQKQKLGSQKSTHGAERKLLLSCLSSVSGINAILGRMKSMIQQVREIKKSDGGLSSLEILKIYLEVLEALLNGEQVVSRLWYDIRDDAPAKQKALWHEVSALLGGGKILNIAAETSSVINDASKEVERSKWITDGALYSRWLARNILCWSKDLPQLSIGLWKPVAELLGKGLRLGHSGMMFGTKFCFI